MLFDVVLFVVVHDAASKATVHKSKIVLILFLFCFVKEYPFGSQTYNMRAPKDVVGGFFFEGLGIGVWSAGVLRRTACALGYERMMHVGPGAGVLHACCLINGGAPSKIIR